MHKIFITCPKGIENLLAEEAKSLGLENIGFTVGGVHGEASLEAIYQLNLWSRLGNRVLLSLFSVVGLVSPGRLHSISDMGALSPLRRPTFTIRVYPPFTS